jgi:hypothetical protein
MVYGNIWLYRAAMSLLYGGRYGTRFARVAGLLRDSDARVLELCFGDTLLAGHCRKLGKAWIGLDVNPAFVARAVRLGFDARRTDLLRADGLPACDVCVMMGSLYHFRDALPELFRRIKVASGRLILSEPVRNWTNGPAPLRFLARRGTRVGAAEETFRFTEATLRAALDGLKKSVGLEYRVAGAARDMIVEVVWSK